MLSVTATPPELPAIPNQLTTEGAPPLAVPLGLSAPLNRDVTLEVTSNRPEFARAAQLLGGGTNRVLRIQPPAGLVGNVVFTVSASDARSTNQTQFALTVRPRELTPLNLTAQIAAQSAAEWADFTGDGYPDLIAYNRGLGSVTVLGNSGGRSLVSLGTLPDSPLAVHTVAWTDSNGDGSLEVLLMGTTKANLYRAETSGRFRFTKLTNSWPFQRFTGAAWGDFDGDGDEDLVMTGRDPEHAPLPAALLENRRGPGLEPLHYGLPSTRERPVVGDFDNDGLPDLLLFNVAGSTNGGVWLNQGGWAFAPSALTVATANVTWRPDSIHSAGTLDFDGDGRLDAWVVQESPRLARSHELLLWRQHAGRLDLHLKLEAEDVRAADAPAWGDFDADGLPDFVLPRLGPELFFTGNGASYQRTNYFALHRSLGDGRFLAGGHLFPSTFGAPATGDFNRDGLPDLLAPGASGFLSRLFTNALRAVNPPPDVPAGLRAIAFESGALFLWKEARDPNQTAALTYNLRIGTRPGGNDVIPSLSLADGTRLVPAPGNCGFNTFRFLTLERFASDRLYWAVQAVDHGHQASPWTAGQELTVGHLINEPPKLVGLTNVTVFTGRRQTLRFSVLDDLSPPERVSVRAWTDDATLLQTDGGEVPFFPSVTVPATNRVLTLAPLSSRLGRTQVTVVATDGHGTATVARFNVTVTPPAGAPQLSVQTGDDASFPALRLHAAPTERLRLERSEDLRLWLPAGEFTVGATGEFAWPLPPTEAEAGASFYRVRPAE